MVNTNGIRIAKDDAFVAKLVQPTCPILKYTCSFDSI